jgi:hypothetical protein
VSVAQGPGSPISTGSIGGDDQAPGWSLVSYRQRLEASRGVSGSRRATLGGPERLHIDAGPFATRAEAERMRHEIEHLGPVAVAMEGEGAEPAFLVRVGPFSSTAAKEAAAEFAGFSALSPTVPEAAAAGGR